jgi:hypothetical protein
VVPGAGDVTSRTRENGYAQAKELFKDIRPELVASAKPHDLPEMIVPPKPLSFG